MRIAAALLVETEVFISEISSLRDLKVEATASLKGAEEFSQVRVSF